jgi:hypothetical protein
LQTRTFVILVISLGWATANADPPVSTERLLALEAQLRADVKYLSSEDLRGRGVDDAESIAKAADYIAGRMQTIGLETDLYDGTPFQKVNLALDAVAGSAERNLVSINIAGAGEELTVNLGAGMTPLAIGSLAGQVSSPLVFAGYGITAPKYNYDDYATVDTAGKIVVLLRKEPGAADPKSPFSGTRNTRHAFFNTKIENAIAHGASAIVLVNDPGSIDRSAKRVRNQIEREEQTRDQMETQLADLPDEAANIRRTLTDKIESAGAMIEGLQNELRQAQDGVIGVAEAGQRPEGKDSVPVISISRSLTNEILKRASGRSLEDLEARIDQNYAPQSFEMTNVKVSLQMELKPSVANTSNVVGVIKGRGPLADESVVVGAHYDHVGMGGYGSLAPGTVAIHNGADDNASGTAALLATAEEARNRLGETVAHRRIIFIAFTGEERGLVGSKHYVRAPRFPLESTVAMINMDMVGRLHDNELTVYGTGSAPMINEILEQVNQRQQFNLFRVATGYGPSDHQSFYEAGIPVIFFFTGLHNDYHRPTDDFQKINFGGLTRITDTVSEVTLQLATRKDRPQYTKTEGLAKIRRQLTAYLGVRLVDRNGRVVLAGLTDGGPAERGGLRIGDTIVKLAGRSMNKPSDVQEQVREHSPRDKVTLRVIRRGTMVDLTIQLGTRPGE